MKDKIKDSSHKKVIRNLIEKPPEIRSKHFFKARIPKIGEKDIPTHNTFGVTITDFTFSNDLLNQSSPVMWGCVLKPRRRCEEKVKERKFWNSPELLLKNYLHRKQRTSYGPDLNPETLNIEKEVSKQKDTKEKDIFSHTLTEFRIKKSKRLTVQHEEEAFLTGFEGKNTLRQHERQTELKNTDADFYSFNMSKKLSEMTQEELESSIRWKKQFLQILNGKIRMSKSHSSGRRTVR